MIENSGEEGKKNLMTVCRPEKPNTVSVLRGPGPAQRLPSSWEEDASRDFGLTVTADSWMV